MPTATKRGLAMGKVMGNKNWLKLMQRYVYHTNGLVAVVNAMPLNHYCGFCNGTALLQYLPHSVFVKPCFNATINSNGNCSNCSIPITNGNNGNINNHGIITIASNAWPKQMAQLQQIKNWH